MLLRRVVPGGALQAAIALTGSLVIPWYFARAARVVYGGSRAATIGRAAVITSTYLVTFVLTMSVSVGLIILLQF